jgi:hypothetical protein
MSLNRMRRSAQSNARRTFLRLERLDVRITPSVGVTRAAMSLAGDAAEIRELQTPTFFKESASPGILPLFAGHVDPFGSKPGGTGEGVS